ncbi:MAG: ubiquinol-cytochrome c reductase core subunit 1 [Geoglossum umbratile]|nr:MAG: ubiquinol-cytochrome c reductase core subunit 1 [Geoglossum umbratile]
MISRSSLGRVTQLASRQCYHQPANRRGVAAAASGTFKFQPGEAAGVKVASRDIAGPTTTLALVAKAGTRYQTLPGVADGLEKFAYKNTQKRSSLRITREAELLGGEISAYHSRENLVLQAKFLRDDLPYFVELLAEVASKTLFTAHEFHEEVIPVLALHQRRLLASAADLANISAHGVAFHRGLGVPFYATSSTPMTKYLTEEAVAAYATAAYAKPNIAVVANGTNPGELAKWTGEFFKDYPTSGGAAKLESSGSKYYGGEERIPHGSGNSMVIAFSGSSHFTAGSSYKPEIAVLAALLGGQSSIKWSPGFSLLAKSISGHLGVTVSTTHAAYSDAGLLSITLNGSAAAVRGASVEVVKTLKSVADGEVSKEDISKAIALAKFRALEAEQEVTYGLELTGSGLIHGASAFQTGEVAKTIGAVNAEQVTKVAKDLRALNQPRPDNLNGPRKALYTNTNPLTIHNRNGICLEGCRPYVLPLGFFTHGEMPLMIPIRYNRYLAVTARVVRRSLKEGPRLQAERRGEMELRFAKWEVSLVPNG